MQPQCWPTPGNNALHSRFLNYFNIKSPFNLGLKPDARLKHVLFILNAQLRMGVSNDSFEQCDHAVSGKVPSMFV